MMSPLDRCRIAIALLSLFLASTAVAIPACEQEDVQELCQIIRDMRAENPKIGQPGGWSIADGQAGDKRNAVRRDRASKILYETAAPTWRDLWNAGYAISYGETPQERLLALAVSIRALSLAPNDPDVHALVAITVDKIALGYVGAQLYGRQKFYPSTSDESRCLPQMIDPPLPATVGKSFDAPSSPIPPCPKGVSERLLDPPIPR